MSVLVAATVLAAGCDASSSGEPGESGRRSGASGAEHGSHSSAAHRPVTPLTSPDGFRFSVAGAGAHTTPTEPDGKTAPPGQTFLYVEIDVTNLHKDRGGSLGEVLSQLVLSVPQTAVPAGADGGPAYVCDTADDGLCSRFARWKHMTTGGEADDLLAFDPDTVTLPPGATWTLRGYFGEPSTVRESLRPGKVQLLVTPNGALMRKNDPRTVIPLS
ncbi:hypothetical protein [Streptomyces sp. NPDC052721]|uniref:hypothetical protein n=1 Tax=Streptomyces sp. NPDC052721 TaxID=3154955 RepID=UPI00341B9C05